MGTRTDPRSDVYALGATMYVLLTGKMPARADQRLLAGAEIDPPGALNPGVPPALEAVVLRALDLAPERRWQSMEELRAALESAWTGRGEDRPTVRVSTRDTATKRIDEARSRPVDVPETPWTSEPAPGGSAWVPWAVGAGIGVVVVAGALVWHPWTNGVTATTTRVADRAPAAPPRATPETVPDVTSPPTTAVPAAPSPAELDARIRDALHAHGVAGVTVSVDDAAVHVDNLRDNDDAARVRDLVAAMPGVTVPVVVHTVPRERAAESDTTRVKPPSGSGWQIIPGSGRRTK
jgi:serine/threonine-protein kinase